MTLRQFYLYIIIQPDSGEGLQARQTSDLNNNQLRTERVLVWHELALLNGLLYVTSVICRLLTRQLFFSSSS